MGVTNLVPYAEAELALLEELVKCGGEGETGTIVEKAMKHFPILQGVEELNRITPSGSDWWSGRFRFDFSRLKRKGEAENIQHGLWRITERGIARLEKAGKVVPENTKRTVRDKMDTVQPKNVNQRKHAQTNGESAANEALSIVGSLCDIKAFIPSLSQQQKVVLNDMLRIIRRLIDEIENSFSDS
ncbi:MAG: winged helix-turn-helix domain-containing protein [Dehalococcoidales bacterium]